MDEIGIEPLGGNAYRVTVSSGGSSTAHEVTATPGDMEHFGAATPEALIEASFRFLLDREPKESILREFDLAVIPRYFPEYETTIIEYL